MSAPCYTLRGAPRPPMSVRTQPGFMLLTSTCGPPACATRRVRAFSAALLAEYAGAYPPMLASCPAPLLTFTTRPYPRARMPGTYAWHSCSGPMTFVSKLSRRTPLSECFPFRRACYGVVMTNSIQRHMAAHEAGHALMAFLQGDRHVEIRADKSGWSTATTQAPWAGMAGLPRKSLKERYLLVCAAGEAGELAMLGCVHTQQASMVLQGLNNDAARFLIAWQGDHAMYGATSQPTSQLITTVHGQFVQTDFNAEWAAHIARCSTEFRRPEVNSALSDLVAAVLTNLTAPTPVSSAQILSIAQIHGL